MRPSTPPPTRRGAVLLIVVGISALLLTALAVALAQVRGEAKEGRLIAQEGQARIMLHAGLAWVLEHARLGQGSESFGWTDVRDGSLGNSWLPEGGSFRGELYAIARPRFAVRSGLSQPVVMPPEWLQAYENAADPSSTQLGRILAPIPSDNGFGPVPATAQHDDDGYIWDRQGPTFMQYTPAPLNSVGLEWHWRKVWQAILTHPLNTTTGTFVNAEGDLVSANYATRPVASTWSDFEVADDSPVPGSQGLGWFRVYRCRQNEIDGSGSPWYNTIPLSGVDSRDYGVFIIACGAGPTRGYREWSEVPSAERSALFAGQEAVFRQFRAQERILFYRVRWSPYIGGVVEPRGRYFPNTGGDSAPEPPHNALVNLVTQRPWHIYHSSDTTKSWDLYGAGHAGLRGPVSTNTTGTISWIERLEREPPAW